MSNWDITSICACLGQAQGTAQIANLLSVLNITGTLKLKRGEFSAYLLNKSIGVELTFKIESAFKLPVEAAEGTLLLSNIRFYGVRTPDFDLYSGDLPNDIFFGMGLDNLKAVLGVPSWQNEALNSYRWDDNSKYLLHVVLDDSGKVEIVSVQHPSS